MASVDGLIALGAAALAAAPAGLLAAGTVTSRSGEWGPVEGWRPPPGGIAAATLFAFVWATAVVPFGPFLVVSLALGWTLICLGAIDLAVFRLPDAFTLPLLAAGLAVAWVLPGRPVLDHLGAAAGGWALLSALARGYRLWRGVEGLGLGDAKLLGAAGAWLGVAALPSVLLIACGAAFAWIAFKVLTEGAGAARARVAFGAPLALAIWVVWLHGPLLA
jgi:leader peptidase (prepilin peptidase)/N-methyltransferase